MFLHEDLQSILIMLEWFTIRIIRTITISEIVYQRRFYNNWETCKMPLTFAHTYCLTYIIINTPTENLNTPNWSWYSSTSCLSVRLSWSSNLYVEESSQKGSACDCNLLWFLLCIKELVWFVISDNGPASDMIWA